MAGCAPLVRCRRCDCAHPIEKAARSGRPFRHDRVGTPGGQSLLSAGFGVEGSATSLEAVWVRVCVSRETLCAVVVEPHPPPAEADPAVKPTMPIAVAIMAKVLDTGSPPFRCVVDETQTV